MRENLSFFVHWPLLLYMKSVSGCFSLHCCAFAFPPWEFSISLSLSPQTDSNMCIEKQIVHTIRYLLSAALKARASERWMGKLNWKHILLGIWSITQLIMTFFSLFLLETSSFLAAPILPLLFSLSLTREWICALVWTQWFNELARKKTFITIYCFFLFKTFRVYCSYIK